MAHAENDGVFVAVHLTEPVLSEGACAALRVEKVNTQHTRNLFLRHNGREALTSWLDISTWISPRHFTLSTLPLSHQTCPSKVSLFFIYVIFSFTQSRNLESSGIFSFLSSFPPFPPLLSKSVIRFFRFHHHIP